MARPSRRSIFDQNKPVVEEVIASLREGKAYASAEAVESILSLAQDAVHLTETKARGDARLNQSFAVAVESGLWTRVSENAPNISEVIIEGWEKFLAGEWMPEQPVRAGNGEALAKANLNVRAPRQLVDQVEAAADQMVARMDWSTVRGYKLNARQVAAQWLARKFPEPADGESEAAR